jgi:hypothetical protein
MTRLSSWVLLDGTGIVSTLLCGRYPEAGRSSWMFLKCMQAENLKQPSPTQVEEYGFTISAQSLGSSGPVDVSFPQFLPL